MQGVIQSDHVYPSIVHPSNNSLCNYTISQPWTWHPSMLFSFLQFYMHLCACVFLCNFITRVGSCRIHNHHYNQDTEQFHHHNDPFYNHTHLPCILQPVAATNLFCLYNFVFWNIFFVYVSFILEICRILECEVQEDPSSLKFNPPFTWRNRLTATFVGFLLKGEVVELMVGKSIVSYTILCSALCDLQTSAALYVKWD